MVTVMDLRGVFDDCWIDIYCDEVDGEEDRCLFAQSQERDSIPAEYLDMEVDWCCIDETLDGEHVIYCRVWGEEN